MSVYVHTAFQDPVRNFAAVLGHTFKIPFFLTSFYLIFQIGLLHFESKNNSPLRGYMQFLTYLLFF